jgi:hypothetical protein
MNGNGTLQHAVRQPGIDGIEKAMNCLVATGPENGGAKYLFRPGIHDNP